MRVSASALALAAFAACVCVAQAKRFTKCSLATLLEERYQMTREDIKNWVCIAQYESTFNSGAVNRANWDGSQDYGLFQINNKYWCDDHYGKNECQLPCSALLDDDLTDDVQCMKKIIRDTERFRGKGNGLKAWVAYVKRCQGRNLDEYMSECWNTISNNIYPNAVPIPGLPKSRPAIVDNARVPIKHKVVSNMHTSNTYNPFLPLYAAPPIPPSRPYSIFYRGY